MAFEHLVDRYWLRLTCRACGRSQRLDPRDLAARYAGHKVTTRDFASRSRCARCGAKAPVASLEPLNPPSLVLPAWDPKTYWRSLRHFVPAH